jgi:hypothetical protein
VRVITGTPNGSAAATDAPGANGTPALPSSCLLLALVRVPAGVTSVLTAHINDRRPWAGGVPTYETSLPSPAADGQEIYYRADSTNGVIWHLRFRNVFNGGNATYPWEFIGGPPLYDAIDTQQNTNSTTYTNLGTAGPTVTTPLAGDYYVTVSTRCFNNTGDSAISYAVGGTAASEDDAAYIGSGASSTNVMATRRKTGIAASTAIQAKYRTATGGANYGTFRNRVLQVTPLRVG